MISLDELGTQHEDQQLGSSPPHQHPHSGPTVQPEHSDVFINQSYSISTAQPEHLD